MNRHLKIAFFMAPVLALATYAITGYFQPSKKQAIGDYQLTLTNDCKPTENSCLLKSGEFELKLISSIKQNKLQLAVLANQPITQLSLALGTESNEFTQFKMMKSDDAKYWQVFLNNDQSLGHFKKMRLASESNKSNFFTEANIYF